MLTGWRILDLTDHRGDVGPYLLADLGAEVIKLEPPDGCPTRDKGAIAGAHFDAYNGNKRSLELSGDRTTDRQLVLDLVATSDLVFDSGPPGRLASMGIDDGDLAAANPSIVSVVVTPFGLEGPRADQPATELTIGALGGSVRLQGTPERAPVKISVPQVWRHTGAEAAVAAMVAHRRMTTTGQPQFVDVSAQSAMTWTMLNAMEAKGIQGRDFERTGSELHLSIKVQLRVEAADGYVVCVPTGRTVRFLLPWLLEDGIVDQSWADIDWDTFDHRAISGEQVELTFEEVAQSVYDLCRRYTKTELFLRGLGYGATLAPLNTLSDLLAFDHLEARTFWTTDAEAAATNGDAKHADRRPGAYYRRDGERPAVTRGPLALDRDGPAIRAELETNQAEAPSTRPETSDEAPAAGESEALPFAGLNVVDFSWIGVGPITAKTLADHGATVVRIESENRIDGLRLQPPFKDAEPGTNRSNFFGTFNTSKMSLAIDLKTEAGRDVARQLIDWADVVIESFTPGAMDRLGFGYDDLTATNPSLIMVSTSLLGAGSPISSMAGYGYHAAALAGFQDVVGWPDLPPDGPWLAYTDTIGPRFIAPTLMAALDRRHRTGTGCHIEAAQLEIALQLLAPELATFQRTNEPLQRRGNRDPGMAPQGAYASQGDDQWLALSIVDDDAWQRFVSLLDRPAWATDPVNDTLAGRLENHDRLDAEIGAWTAGHDGPELEVLLTQHGIAAGVVLGSGQLLDDPQYAHRDFYQYLEHDEVGVVPYAGHQYRIQGYNHGPRSAGPCIGQHSFEVLSDILGLDADRIAEIAAAEALV